MNGAPALLAFAMLLTGLSAVVNSGSRVTIDVRTFGARPDSGEDATEPFSHAIEAAKQVGGPVTLLVPKGRYDFFSTHATRRRCYYSNATEDGSDAMRTIALDFSGLKGLRIEGEGAKLVMRGKMTMLVAQNCRDLAIHGVEFDFARPTVSEMTAIEKGDGYWVGRVHKDSTFRIVGERIQWFGEDWAAYHNLVQHFDPERQTTWRGGDPTAGATKVSQVGDHLVRFEVPPDALREAVVGRTYQFRDVTRDETGMWFDRCRNVSLEGVKVRAMAGFGMLFQFTENVEIKALLVAPDPSSGRTCASAADILHFSSCRGKVRVLGSVLAAAHDDAINIHGVHLRVVASPDERKIRVRFMHGQTWGYAAFQPGDRIEFLRKETLRPYSVAKVERVEMTSDPREQILTLDHPVPAGLALGSDAVENITWTPSVEILECDISRVPTRGILVTTRGRVRIQRNRFFRIPMPSVLVEDDAQGWYESGSVRNLLIEGNTFFECSGPVVEMNPQNSIYAGPVHRNLRVIGNHFDHCALPIVTARALDGLEFRDNTGVTSKDAVHATQSTRVRVTGAP